MILHPEARLELTLFKLVTNVLGGMSASYGIKVEAHKEYRSHAKIVAYVTASTTRSCCARSRQSDSLMHGF